MHLRNKAFRNLKGSITKHSKLVHHQSVYLPTTVYYARDYKNVEQINLQNANHCVESFVNQV